jgi:hypothetical protein
MGLNMKDKKALLDEFTKLSGYHRKLAVHLLNAKLTKQLMLYIDGNPVRIMPQKKRPSNRKGKRIYSDQAIGCLRLVWAFFLFKCGKILAPLCASKYASSQSPRPSASQMKTPLLT